MASSSEAGLGSSYESGNVVGGSAGAVGLHRPVVDRAAHLGGDGVGDGGGVAGGVVRPPPRPIAVEGERVDLEVGMELAPLAGDHDGFGGTIVAANSCRSPLSFTG